jgi:predicted kinase
MIRPLLIVVTGTPASGKTTLAHILSRKIKCPILSRDEIKEGHLYTLNQSHKEMDKSVDLHIYQTFFEITDLFISKGISIIIEAAFQDKLWKPKLLEFEGKAEIKIIVCKTNNKLIKSRFTSRILSDAGREKFHGDKSISKEHFDSLTKNYQPVRINKPTLEVDTTNGYKPVIQEIVKFLIQKTS